VVGYEDLDDQGSWQPTSYGYMWFPRGLQPGWAPYQQGHWAYVPPWGYTWVDDNRWGFAPFHYGRWASVDGAWGWIPAPPPAPGAIYVRPVYAPALVAWVGAGATIAWFALGPREVYVPSYPVSRGYVERINVSNTTVSATVINNVYINNTVINNKTVNNTTIHYVNRSVPGAVTATSQQAFTSAEPVSRNRVAVDARALAAAPVRTAAPPIVPTRQAVLGPGAATTERPPAAVLARPIVARTAPPPMPPSFAQRQHAIESNGGRPLSVAQVRQIQPAPAAAQRAAAIRVAPPPRTLITSKAPAGAAHAPAAGELRPSRAEPERPVEPAPGSAPPRAPTHVNETPPPARSAAPSTASSVLERQHLQEQQQLRAQQEAERQRIQQQQEADHQKLAQQQAAEAQRREQGAALEQRHAEQTQELAQRHAEEQQQLLERQQRQRSQQQVAPPAPMPPAPKPAAPKPEPKPDRR
jgi:flagellar biosynthesis GTPase FlhF